MKKVKLDKETITTIARTITSTTSTTTTTTTTNRVDYDAFIPGKFERY